MPELVDRTKSSAVSRQCSQSMQPDFLNVQVGDVVAVKPLSEKAYLAQVLYAKGGARTVVPYFVQMCREPDCAVMNTCPSWITQRLPRRPEPEPQDFGKPR